MREIDTDYLVVGAGAAGMAFVDTLLEETDCEVVLVDRRDRPGGHWNDAYPFVRLHSPSSTYGVGSRVLGSNRIDEDGPNAGYYELATGAEICHYYERVLDERFLRSGRVRFLGMSDYVGEGPDGPRIVSRVNGATTTVRVRRKIVDATYLEASVPATHTRSFDVDADARCVPIGDLVRVAEPATGYTVLGSGKTAMDACCWLLDRGVDPDRIRWVRPRDAWMLDRANLQGMALLPALMEGFAAGQEAAADAEDVEDLFRRLEACGQLVRLDLSVEPTMFRGAITSAAERDSLRQIERVVRLGHVRRIASDRIVLDGGTVPAGSGDLHVDCTADGLTTRDARPIFEPGRITLQSMTSGLVPFNSALLAYVEATHDDDAEKNRLCPPNPNPTRAADWIPVMAIAGRARAAWFEQPDLMEWLEHCRLNLTCGMTEHLGDPRMMAAFTRMAETMQPAIDNLERLCAQVPAGAH